MNPDLMLYASALLVAAAEGDHAKLKKIAEFLREDQDLSGLKATIATGRLACARAFEEANGWAHTDTHRLLDVATIINAPI